MDMSGIEPDPSRMLSERDNQLHHMPLHCEDLQCTIFHAELFSA